KMSSGAVLGRGTGSKGPTTTIPSPTGREAVSIFNECTVPYKPRRVMELPWKELPTTDSAGGADADTLRVLYCKKTQPQPCASRTSEQLKLVKLTYDTFVAWSGP
ncbi:hypothetical protein Vretifemale_20459, partial [Volvox reticuliferus]